MSIPPITIPRRGPRLTFAAEGYGLLIMLWLGLEDTSIWPVTLLGAGLALLVSLLTIIAHRAGTILGGKRLLAGGTIGGGIAGSLSAPLTALLMLIKTAAHSHVYPDYPLSAISATLIRLPAWTLAGALLGLGSVLCWIGLRGTTRQ